ncbi:MAG: type VI secretion system baseplate subunit TssK [Candidatus Cloacimonetes bacterium]|nr:type VI secretion system baseplate subunit TssK [Candidatus Cloacimonadota bacterium]
MKQKKQIFWHQGLFLQPHHFQQNNLKNESAITFVANSQQPFFWGVSELEIQVKSLKNKVFEISNGIFIFQDGAVVTLPGNSRLQPRPINIEKLTEGKPVKVFLGLRKWDESGVNLTPLKLTDPPQNIETRFTSDSNLSEVQNLYQTGQTAHIQFMEYQLKLFWENEIKDAGEYNLIPVAIIEYNKDELSIDRRFIPPAISLSGSEVLLKCVKDIREQLTLRCHQLEEYKSNLKISKVDLDPAFLTYLLALLTLNRYTPLFHHILETPELHPWNVYGVIRQLIGELSTFDLRINVLGKSNDGKKSLPNYNHENISGCYFAAQTLISELLGSILIGPENVIKLVREEEQFKGDIPRELFSIEYSFYLVIRTTAEPERISDDIKNNAKLSSIDAIPILISRSLPGIELEYHSITPLGIPKKENSYYFKLVKTHEQWQDIVKNRNISLYWDKAPEDTEAEIVILKN